MPYDNECIFANKESEVCFGKVCDRVMCKFGHEDDSESDEVEEINEDDDYIEVEIDVNHETIAPCIETIRKSLERVTII